MKKCFFLILIFAANILASFNLFAFDGQVIYLKIKDHKFIPETIYAEAEKKIKLVVENEDNEVEEFESSSLNRERIVPALSSVNIILAPLEVGSYEFMGEFHQDTARGVLVVYDKKDDKKNKDSESKNN